MGHNRGDVLMGSTTTGRVEDMGPPPQGHSAFFHHHGEVRRQWATTMGTFSWVPPSQRRFKAQGNRHCDVLLISTTTGRFKGNGSRPRGHSDGFHHQGEVLRRGDVLMYFSATGRFEGTGPPRQRCFASFHHDGDVLKAWGMRHGDVLMSSTTMGRF